MIQLSDTTLRDGAQGEGISFSMDDKLRIVASLDELGISWIEAGNPGANAQDEAFFESVQRLYPLRHSVLIAFGSTCRPELQPWEDISLVKLGSCSAGIKLIFGKSSMHQVMSVLRCAPEKNIDMIRASVDYLKRNGNHVWFDAEHFFDGYKENPEYALQTLQAAEEAGAERVILCDTRGASFPEEIFDSVCAVKTRLNIPLGIHCHNDMGLATACSLSAVKAGCDLVQGTVSGIGERCGNADLCTLIPILALCLHNPCLPEGNLQKLTHVSREIMEILNVVPNERAPFIGNSAFAHKAGMHIDAVIKEPSSYELMDPELVGNQRRFLLSEQSGRAGLYARLGRILPDLNRDSPEITKVINRIKEMEALGYTYENGDGSFELLALDTLGRRPHYYTVADYHVLCQNSDSRNKLSAQAYLKVNVNGQEGINASEGDGPVNALDLALRKTLSQFFPSVGKMNLKDFKVRVLNMKGTASRVRVSIESSDGNHIWNTVGVSENIIEACLTALIDSVDYMLAKYVSEEEISSAFCK